MAHRSLHLLCKGPTNLESFSNLGLRRTRDAVCLAKLELGFLPSEIPDFFASQACLGIAPLPLGAVSEATSYHGAGSLRYF